MTLLIFEWKILILAREKGTDLGIKVSNNQQLTKQLKLCLFFYSTRSVNLWINLFDDISEIF